MDEEHTLRAVEYGKILLAKEGGNLLVVIWALYLHDVGWSRVDFYDFISFPTREKRYARSLLLHMKYGSEIAKQVLERMDYDQAFTDKMVSIIAVHDAPEEFQGMEDIDATIVFEADHLDKFGAWGERRLSQMFGVQGQNELTEYLEHYK